MTEAVIATVAKLVDDAQAEGWREPTHSTIEFVIGRAGLAEADPKRLPGPPVGKAKRVPR